MEMQSQTSSDLSALLKLSVEERAVDGHLLDVAGVRVVAIGRCDHAELIGVHSETLPLATMV